MCHNNIREIVYPACDAVLPALLERASYRFVLFVHNRSLMTTDHISVGQLSFEFWRQVHLICSRAKLHANFRVETVVTLLIAAKILIVIQT